MDDKDSIAKVADELLQQFSSVLDDYTAVFMELDRADALTDELTNEMVLAEYNYSQLEAFCELDPYGFVLKYSFICDVDDESILDEILLAENLG